VLGLFICTCIPSHANPHYYTRDPVTPRQHPPVDIYCVAFLSLPPPHVLSVSSPNRMMIITVSGQSDRHTDEHKHRQASSTPHKETRVYARLHLCKTSPIPSFFPCTSLDRFQCCVHFANLAEIPLGAQYPTSASGRGVTAHHPSTLLATMKDCQGGI
jgi:hypothetical protein